MADTRWFRDAKFGLFVHFGLYSIPAGIWRGGKSGRNGYSEWIRYQWGWPEPGGIAQQDYDTLLTQFNPQRLDADLLCREAAAAGMRYFVFTTKHHDGFSLWPSAVCDYGVARTPCGRDLVGEMVTAGRRHGLKVGFYYSHWLDWHHPGGALPPWPEMAGDPVVQQPDDAAFDEYWRGKCLPQVAELMERYQPDLFWFDSWGERRSGQLTAARLSRLIAWVRERDPQVLINSRIGTEDGVDYLSMGDNEFPAAGFPQAWETSATMNDSWGYAQADTNFRPTGQLLRLLIDNASRGGNMQLNIGPKGDGSIQPAVLRRMRDLAAWMSINSAALHGSRTVAAEEPAWGRLLQQGDTLYAFVYAWPEDRRLLLPRLPRRIRSGTVVETEASLGLETTPAGQVLLLPHALPDDRVAVLALDW